MDHGELAQEVPCPAARRDGRRHCGVNLTSENRYLMARLREVALYNHQLLEDGKYRYRHSNGDPH